MLKLPFNRAALVFVLVALVAGVAAISLTPRGNERWPVTADFVDTTGVYVGNEVQYLGVPVGEITAIVPRGTVMRVHMRVEAGVKVPRDAVAEILQSALLTDRYVELGPVYRGGPALAAGAHVPVEHTRSPLSFDDLGKAIDALVVALDREGPDGRDIGDLVAVTAENLDGNGARIRRLVESSREALATINRKEPDLQAITDNLVVLARVLGERDATVRRFTTNLRETSDVVDGQTKTLDKTLRSLAALIAEVSSFMDNNRELLTSNLRDAAAVMHTIRGHQAELSRVFDYMPTGSENLVRAYDPVSRSMRVQIAAGDTLVFNPTVRQGLCPAGAPELCPLLTNAQGTGILDQLFDGVESQFPEGP